MMDEFHSAPPPLGDGILMRTKFSIRTLVQNGAVYIDRLDLMNSLAAVIADVRIQDADDAELVHGLEWVRDLIDGLKVK